ncbi:hypothetical protein G6F60_002626 [Rhizopus arrhizus]|nr:hypothetical protein G6F60_002626 [Rhizopus arrhizus]
MLSAMSSLTYSIKPVGKETLSPNSPAATSNTPTEVEEMDTAEEIEETQEVSVEGSEEDEVLFFWTTPRWDLHPFDIQQPTQQLPQQSQPKQRLISTVDSNLQRTTKKIIPTDKQHYNIPSDGIKPGGRLQRFYQQWKKITSHRWPLSVVQEGYKIQFNKTPQPWKIRPLHLNQIEQQAVNEAVLKFLKTDIIEISPDQNTDYLSNFFTIQEPNKRRPILDCQKINQFIQCHHFKMEGVPALRELMEKNDYMCKLDLKDAYVVVGLHPQSRKYLTFMNQGVPRLSIQFHNHEDHSAYDKNQQIDQPNKTGFITTDENLQMRDLARSLQIHQQKWEAPFNLSSHSITELQWWINLVSSKNGLPIQRIENEQPAITIHVDASDIAWGVASPELETMGYWTNEEKGHSINVRELSAILFAIQLHAKKRHFIPTFTRSRSKNSRHLQSVQVKGRIPSYTWSKQHSGRLTQSSTHGEPTVRSNDSQSHIQQDQQEMGTINNRCIRVETKSPITSVLEPQTRSRSHSIGCLQSAVDNERDVLIPTLEIHSPDKHPVEKTEDQRCSTNNTMVDNATLVPNDLTNETHCSANNVQDRQMENGRMALIRSKRQMQGMTEDEIEFLEYSIRKNTRKVYNNGWKKWENWCKQQLPTVNPQAYDPDNVLNFLMNHRNYSSQHLNGLRSSIASVFRVLHPNETSLAQQEKIVQFFQAKRHQEVKTPTEADLSTWDTDIVVHYAKTNWRNNHQLTLFDLQKKTLIILCLATMARPRSDIGRLMYKNVQFTLQDNMPVSVLLFFPEAKETNMKTARFGLIDKVEVCLTRTLFHFIQRTQSYRQNLPEDHTLFLTYLDNKNKTSSSVRPSTVSSWVK